MGEGWRVYLAAAEAAGHKVGANAVSALVEALAAAGRTEAALAAFRKGRAEGVQPLPYAVGTMIMALGRAAMVDDMMALFRETRRGVRGAQKGEKKNEEWRSREHGGDGERGEGGRQWEGVTWQQEMRSGHALVVQTLACLVQLHDVQYVPPACPRCLLPSLSPFVLPSLSPFLLPSLSPFLLSSLPPSLPQHALLLQTLACLVQLYAVQYGPCLHCLPPALPPYPSPSLPLTITHAPSLSSHPLCFS
ncbi:unnamed protein product, partial [Closterium sp. Yama58-4]